MGKKIKIILFCEVCEKDVPIKDKACSSEDYTWYEVVCALCGHAIYVD